MHILHTHTHALHTHKMNTHTKPTHTQTYTRTVVDWLVECAWLHYIAKVGKEEFIGAFKCTVLRPLVFRGPILMEQCAWRLLCEEGITGIMNWNSMIWPYIFTLRDRRQTDGQTYRWTGEESEGERWQMGIYLHIIWQRGSVVLYSSKCQIRK